MAVFLLTLLAMLVIVAAMSIGVLLGRKPIAGSCGGIGALGMGAGCDVCGGNRAKCVDNTEAEPPDPTLAYQASRPDDH